MSGDREYRSFLQKKAPIIAEYVQQESGLFASSAARNFAHVPGHVHKRALLLELETKFKLDAANFDVMREAVEYKLRLAGVELDEQALASRLEFEIRRAELFADLARELDDLKHGRAVDSHVLDVLAAHITLRGVALQYAEVNTRSEIEALRLQELEQEVRTHPQMYELAGKKVDLANARLELAQEKLLIIPPIMSMIAAQELVLETERDVIMPAMTDLIDAKGILISVQKTDLLPAMSALAASITAWAEARPDVVVEMIAKAQAAFDLTTAEDAELTAQMLAAATDRYSAATKALALRSAEDAQITSAMLDAATDRKSAATAAQNLANSEHTFLHAALLAAANARLASASAASSTLGPREEVANAEVTKATNMALQAAQEVLLAQEELALAQARQGLTAPLQAKAGALHDDAAKQGELSAALLEEVPLREAIAASKLLAATYRLASVSGEVESLLADVTVDEVRTAMERIRIAIDILRRSGEAERVSQELARLGDLLEHKNELAVLREGELSELVSSREQRVTVETERRAWWRTQVADIKVEADKDYQKAYGKDRYYEQVDVAKINAIREITSKLIHQIS